MYNYIKSYPFNLDLRYKYKYTVLLCGHVYDSEYVNRLLCIDRLFAKCPECCKSITNYAVLWHSLDQDISMTKMPLDIQYQVYIACNDCRNSSISNYHYIGVKCVLCGSYNTYCENDKIEID